MQDTKIASLERNIRDLEDEIQMLKTNGLLNTEDREEEMKQMEIYKSHSKFMKNKVFLVELMFGMDRLPRRHDCTPSLIRAFHVFCLHHFIHDFCCLGDERESD